MLRRDHRILPNVSSARACNETSFMSQGFGDHRPVDFGGCEIVHDARSMLDQLHFTTCTSRSRPISRQAKASNDTQQSRGARSQGAQIIANHRAWRACDSGKVRLSEEEADALPTWNAYRDMIFEDDLHTTLNEANTNAKFVLPHHFQQLRFTNKKKPGRLAQHRRIPRLDFGDKICLGNNSGNFFISQSCAICLNRYAEQELLTQLPCQHEFHSSCISEWLKSRPHCPVCRR